MKEKIIIGVDVGGTKIMTGAINREGKIIGTPVKFPTGSEEPHQNIVDRIILSIEKTLSQINYTIDEIAGIGLGVTGPLDIENGIILECPQLPTMHYFPLRDTIQKYFSVPVVMNNDANCLIYGETVFGIGNGRKNVVGFTLGTGIGCAIIIDNKILNGSTGTAGEVWISPYGKGIIEDYVSGSGVSKIYKSITGDTKTSLEIFQLAEKNDVNALQTWKEFGEHLAVAIAWSVNLVNPEIVILGGSIAKAGKYFIDTTREKLKTQVCAEAGEKTEIVFAKLDDYAGFIGAACIVLEEKEGTN